MYTIHPVTGGKWAVVPPPDKPAPSLVLDETEIEALIVALQEWREGEFDVELEPTDEKIFNSSYIGYQEANQYVIDQYKDTVSATSWSHVAREVATVKGAIKRNRQWWIPRDEFMKWLKVRYGLVTREEYKEMRGDS